MVDNIRYGVTQTYIDHPQRSKALIASADIPAIKPHMVEWLANQVAEDPSRVLYYNVISQQVMEASFPNSSRTYIPFKDVSVCGGDLNVVDKNIFASERPVWQKLTDARKRPLKQAGLIGFTTCCWLPRLITLEGAVKRVVKRLDLDARALLNPYAEIGMDADKPHQLAILRDYLQESL